MARKAISLLFFGAFSALFAVSHIIFPALAFLFVYYKLQGLFDTTVGSGTWPPAWPAARTRLVLLMAAVPTWAAGMAVAMLVGRFASMYLFRARRLRSEYEMAADADPEQKPVSPRNKHLSRLVRYRWHAKFGVYVFLAMLGVYMYKTYECPGDVRYRPLVEAAVRSPKPQGYGNGEKIYIAAMFFNSERIVPRWGEEMIKVVQYIGVENAFVSVVESNSGDHTANLLQDLEKKLNALGVPNRIVVRDTSIPRPPSMDSAPPRIEFLSAVRNLALEPLVKNGGYDRIIFSNDIFFEADSVVELLKTRGGDWDMVCGLDLSYWGLYDAWVTRDRLGRLVSSLWPYFLEDAGMQAVMADEPAPVFTCWNGIVAIRAEPFLPVALRPSNGRLAKSPLPHTLPPTHPASPQSPDTSPANTPPLRFRASAPKECFSSESFNLPYDLRRQFDMQEIYVNPRVITSYDWKFYVWYKYVTRHWAVKWWIENYEQGYGMHLAKMVIGNAKNIWTWDGGECQPWS